MTNLHRLFHDAVSKTQKEYSLAIVGLGEESIILEVQRYKDGSQPVATAC